MLFLICGVSPARPSPRCCVVLLSFGSPFGVVGRSSRYRVHRGNLFAGVGRVRRKRGAGFSGSSRSLLTMCGLGARRGHAVSYMWGVAGSPVAPLLCGLAVVRVAFWCNGAVEPLPGTSWQLVRWCGPPGLANFDFGCRFSVILKEFSFLGYLGLSLLLVSAGRSSPPGSPGCGLSVGARRGRLLLGSLRLDDVGRKNCV